MHPALKAEIDRLAELAHLGAEQAAVAFEQMVDRSIRVASPVVCDGESWPAADRGADEDGRGSVGVFFEFEGCLEALVGIVFPASASEILVRRVVGVASGALASALIESALMEVGNILASHVASGIADRLQSRLLPSIPSLAMQDAEGALRDFIEGIAGSDALRIESAFSDEFEEVRGRFVLVPTQVAHWAPIHPDSETPDV